MNKFLQFFSLVILLGFSLNFFGQSANNVCTSATSLTIGAPCTAGSIVALNTNTGEPSGAPCFGFANDDGVWYKFTATATNAFVNLYDNGLSYTPMTAVYNGGAAPGSCPASTATPIAGGGCVNYTTGPYEELGLTGLTVGNVYYILCDMPSTIAQNFCIKVYNAPPMTTASSGCPAAVNSSVSLMTCADVGTTNLETSAGVVTYSNAGSAVPSPAPTCGASFSGGSWAHYDLAAGVTALTFNWEDAYGGSAASGNHSIYAQIYQGTSCAALTTFSCTQIGSFSAGAFSVGNAVIQNLDPTQDVWVYMFDDSNKAFTLPYDIVGSSTPVNDACSGATSSSTGCNLGAIGDNLGGSGTLGGPMNEGSAACSGGTWYSNENTVWYTFSATTTTANVSINSITCNNGESGLAQFAAFTSCACATNNLYGTLPCYLGCAAGTGTISLGSLAPGQTIYLAVDGNAGDVCKMGFNTTLVPLPITWLDFDAFKDGGNIKLFWSTATEQNANHFDIERSDDGFVFSTIGNVKATGNSSERRDYSFIDYSSENKQIYYRLKQYDLDGTFAYSKIIFVDLDAETQEPEIFFAEVDKLITIKSYSKGFDNYDVEILDPFGKPAMESQKTDFQTENTYSIPVHSLAKGVYIINMKSNEGYRSYTKKIVIY